MTKFQFPRSTSIATVLTKVFIPERLYRAANWKSDNAGRLLERTGCEQGAVEALALRAVLCSDCSPKRLHAKRWRELHCIALHCKKWTCFSYFGNHERRENCHFLSMEKCTAHKPVCFLFWKKLHHKCMLWAPFFPGGMLRTFLLLRRETLMRLWLPPWKACCFTLASAENMEWQNSSRQKANLLLWILLYENKTEKAFLQQTLFLATRPFFH